MAESFKNSGGALIARVVRGGPADRGGIKPGDILFSVDGKTVTDSSSMLNLVAALEPGKSVALIVARNQTQVSLKIAIGKRPKLAEKSDDN